MSDGTTPSHAAEAIVERSGAIDRRPPERQVVAVTGASSFLGANLIGMLEEDDRIRRIVCLDVKAPPTARIDEITRTYKLDQAECRCPRRRSWPRRR